MDDREFLAMIEGVELLANDTVERLRHAQSESTNIDGKWHFYQLIQSLYYRLIAIRSKLSDVSELAAGLQLGPFVPVVETISGDYDVLMAKVMTEDFDLNDRLNEQSTAEDWVSTAHDIIDAGIRELHGMSNVAFQEFLALVNTPTEREPEITFTEDNTRINLAFDCVRDNFISTPQEIIEIIKARRGEIIMKSMVKYRAAFILRPLVEFFRIKASTHRYIKVRIGSDPGISLCGEKSLMNNYKAALNDEAKQLEELTLLKGEFKTSLLKSNTDFDLL